MAEDSLKASLTNGWWVLPDNRPFVPASCAWEFVQQCHQGTHLGKTRLAELVNKTAYVERVHQLTAAASARCVTCAQNNPRQGPLQPPGTNRVGDSPFEVLVTDFTEMPRCGPYRYLLTIVCCYTGWLEAFPTRTEQAKEVARVLLKEILPRFGLPLRLSSDNGPAFIHHVIQQLAKCLRISWSLHCAWRAQSSAAVERSHRFLKNVLAKLCQETKLTWVELLPLALFRMRCTPQGALKLSPFEKLYGRAPPLIRPTGGDIKELGQLHLQENVIMLGKVIQELQKYVQENRPLPITQVHPFEPGQSVWLKDWRGEDLQPKWVGPYTVILASSLGVKLAGIKPWVHYTRVKPAQGNWTVTTNPDNPLQVKIRRSTPADDPDPLAAAERPAPPSLPAPPTASAPPQP